MAYPSVDLNLFVNAMSRGEADGLKEPSAFSSFVGGAISGFDAEQKAQAQRDENEIRENQIAQQPVENRIKEAQADKADAELAGYRNDPEGYAKLQAQKLSNEKAQQQQIEQYNAKRTEFIDIMSDDSEGAGVKKGQAYLSGKYDEVLAKEPNLDKQSLQKTYGYWDPADQKTYQTLQQKKRTTDWMQQTQESFQKKALTNNEAYIGSDSIADLAEKSGANPADLIEKGYVRQIQVADKVPVTEQVPDVNDPTKMITQPKKDQYGSIVMREPNEQELRDLKSNDIKVKNAFYYDGKMITDDLDNETAKIYKNQKQTYKYITNQMPDQGGAHDLTRDADQIQSRKAAQDAAAKAEGDRKAADQASYESSFNAGARINPAYTPAATKVKAERDANIAELEAKNGPSPHAPEGPNLPAHEAEGPNLPKTISIPTGTITNTPTLSVTDQILHASRTALGLDAGTGKPIDETAIAQNQLKQNVAAAKVQNQFQQLKQKDPNAAPKGEMPPPTEQAKAVTAPSFVPPQMQVLDTKHTPNENAIKAVAARPEVRGYSALTKAMITTESGGNVNAKSPTSVVGLAQVTGKTAKGISPDLDPANPVDSVMLGAIELEKQLANPKFANNPMLALSAYNVGAGPIADAIDLAGSTDWEKVKVQIPRAVMSPKWAEYWQQKGIDSKQKALEAFEYADKVIVNFPSFVSTRSDMTIANSLKAQKVIRF